MPSSATSPRPEHPRPDLRRDAPGAWASLNGPWDFAFDPDDAGEAQAWFGPGHAAFTRTIVVPFPWESHAAWGTEAWAGNDNWFSPQAYLDPAGVTRDNYTTAPRHTIGWYRRRVTVPARAASERLFLHLGAADWDVKVWVNGQRVGEGRSGYVPFSCDITEALAPGAAEAEVVIRVHDPQGTEDKPLGKQHKWYTTTSGIWQPVWLEVRPERHLTGVQITPHLSPASLSCAIAANVALDGLACRVEVRDTDGTVVADHCGASGAGCLEVPLAGEPRPWHPDSPHLYDVTVELREGETVVDTVQTYCGLREVGIAPLCEGGPKYLTLNGEPIYLKGALDQSFNPWGVYAWCSDADIIRDLQLAKDTGLNFLRIHIKPEDPRFLYWADRMGMLIMYDFANLGYDGYGETGCERWEWTFRELLARDFNHPCIFAWVLFNETWGLGFKEYAQAPDRQEWVKRMFRLAKALDPSRPIEDNSVCSYDHVLTDINSWHFYINDYEKAREHVAKVVAETYPGSAFNYVGGNTQGDEPLLNSEYGGVGARMGDIDVSWCFKFLTDLLRREEKVCGYVYTELQDIEWEYNGFYNYDRTPKDFGYSLRELQGPFYLGVDGPPAQTLAPGATFAPRVFVNRVGHSGALPEMVYRYVLTDSLGETRTLAEGALTWPESTSAILTADVPGVVCDEEGSLVRFEACFKGLAATFAVAEFRADGLPAVEHRAAERRCILRKLAGDVEVSTAWHEAEVERGVVDYQQHLLGGVEAGHMDYRFALPEGMSLQQARSLTLVCEASSKRPGAPQTHCGGPHWPSDLVVSMNGIPIHTTTLGDQYADSRGALSHLHGFRGRYGELIHLEVAGDALDLIRRQDSGAVLVRLEVPRSASNHRGLVVYSSRAGRTPCDVTLIVSQ
jgi:hypothetical protein